MKLDAGAFDMAREKIGINKEGRKLVECVEEEMMMSAAADASEESSKCLSKLIDNILDAATSTIAFRDDDDFGMISCKGKDRKDIESETMNAVEQAIGASMNAVVEKGFKVSKWAVTQSVPFGGVLIGIGEAAVEELVAMEGSNTAAEEIKVLIFRIVDHLPDFLDIYCSDNGNDADGQRVLDELLKNVVIAMLLAKALSAKGWDCTDKSKQFVLSIFNTTDNVIALVECSKLLYSSLVLITVYMARRSINVVRALEDETSMVGAMKVSIETHSSEPVLRTANSANTSAVSICNDSIDSIAKVNDAKEKSKYLEALLAPTKLGSDFVKHRNQYMEGSRIWLVNEVKDWITSETPSRVFLIDWTSGCGKSIFAAKLVDIAAEMKKEEGNGWLFIGGYYFCKHDDSKRKSPSHVIASLAYQLSQSIPEMEIALSKLDPKLLRDVASGIYNDFEKEVFEVLLVKPLTEALSSWPLDRRVCLLIDALDELDEGSNSRNHLLSLVGRGLLSLPSQVHVILTSRPDKDILAHLRQIKPCEIIMKNEKQRYDLRLYARKMIVEGTSLKLLSVKEQDEVVDLLVSKSDGVFIALRFSYEHLIKIKQGNIRVLKKDDVVNLPTNLIDDTYKESFRRVYSRIEDIQDLDIRKTVSSALKKALAVLVASSKPLTTEELTSFCSGSKIQDELLTRLMLSSVSLLFSFSTSGLIEPLHKTVYDFLLDKERSMAYSVDVVEGHTILAKSCAEILQKRVLSPTYSCRKVGKENSNNNVDMYYDEIDSMVQDKLMSSMDLYALEYGHVHFAKALMLLTKQQRANFDSSLDYATIGLMLAWESLLLAKRVQPTLQEEIIYNTNKSTETTKEAFFGETEDKKHRFYRSNMAAKVCSLKWILLHARLGRTNRFTVELEALKEAISVVGSKDLPSIKSFLSTTIWLLRSYFNSEWKVRRHNSVGISGMREAVGYSFQNAPVTCEWYESPAAAMWSQCKMTLPLRVGISQLRKTLIGHFDIVSSIAFTKDCSKIISGSWDNTAKIWDAVTGEVIHTLKGHTSRITSVSFNRDESKVITVCFDNTFKVWDTMTGEVFHALCSHTDSVRSVAFSLDGITIVSGSDDKTVKIWDAYSGEVIKTLYGHTKAVTSVAISNDGRIVASSSIQKSIKVWDVTTEKMIKTLTGHSKTVMSVSFSKDGDKILSCDDNTIKIWDALSGEVMRTLRSQYFFLNSVAFNSDCSTIASCNSDNTIKIWDVVTREVISSLTGHTSLVTSVSFSSDGWTVISGSEDSTIKVWDASKGTVIKTLQGHSSAVHSVSFSHMCSKIASCSSDKSLKIWDTLTGEVIHSINKHSDCVLSVSFSQDGTRVVSGSKDRTVKIWDALKGDIIQLQKKYTSNVSLVVLSKDGLKKVVLGDDKTVVIRDELSGETIQTLTGHSSRVSSVIFSRDDTKIATSSADNTVKIWDALTEDTVEYLDGYAGTVTSVALCSQFSIAVSGSSNLVMVWDLLIGRLISTLRGHSSEVLAVACSSDCAKVASASKDKSVKIWSTLTGRVIHTLIGHSGYVTSVAVSNDFSRIVSGSLDHTAVVWDALSGKEIRTLNGHIKGVTSVSYSSDDKLILTGSLDSNIKVWDAATGAVFKTINCYSSLVASLAFSRDGLRIVSSISDATIKVWDTFTGGMIQIFKGHAADVTSVAFSSDGSQVVSGSKDGCIKIWDAYSGEVIKSLKGHSGSITSMALNSDGSQVVSGSEDGCLKIWDTLTS